MVLGPLHQLYVLCVLAGMSSGANTPQCWPMADGKTGPKNSVVLSLYRCVKTPSSKETVCMKSPSTRILLEQDEVVDLSFDVNKYAVTAEYFGEEVCVAYKASGIHTNSSDVIFIGGDCISSCFKYNKTETYYTRLFCSDDGCSGGEEKFKFVVTDVEAASISMSAVLSLLLLLISTVLSLNSTL
jgi:hypothetical protein